MKCNKSVAALSGAFAVSVLTLSVANANPFAMESLSSVYQVAAEEKKDADGKCGEGKCGGAKTADKKADGKCGEGKCGGSKTSDKKADGKCGEGKCGGNK